LSSALRTSFPLAFLKNILTRSDTETSASLHFMSDHGCP
jgi:hypothetical protein